MIDEQMQHVETYQYYFDYECEEAEKLIEKANKKISKNIKLFENNHFQKEKDNNFYKIEVYGEIKDKLRDFLINFGDD